MVVVDDRGNVIWRGGLPLRELSNLQWVIDNVLRGADLHVFTNYQVVCRNPEISRHIHSYPGADEFEVAQQRELFDEARARYGARP